VRLRPSTASDEGVAEVPTADEAFAATEMAAHHVRAHVVSAPARLHGGPAEMASAAEVATSAEAVAASAVTTSAPRRCGARDREARERNRDTNPFPSRHR
jgi:hypothetical protein